MLNLPQHLVRILRQQFGCRTFKLGESAAETGVAKACRFSAPENQNFEAGVMRATECPVLDRETECNK
jgi:hypothetical protein